MSAARRATVAQPSAQPARTPSEDSDTVKIVLPANLRRTLRRYAADRLMPVATAARSLIVSALKAEGVYP